MFIVAGVGYVAFGLSRDNLMGDDSVIECIAQGDTISAFTSWNTATFGNTRQGVVSQGHNFVFENLNFGSTFLPVF